MIPETIHWRDAAVALPDSDETVLIRQPEGDDPVWLGYHDGTRWLTVDAWETPVTHWAPMPEGPKP